MIYQEAITEYQGTVITVSHDRYFIKQIVNRVVEVKNFNLQDYAGDYNVSALPPFPPLLA
jgi:ATPase subunit of ABC transporter with duplicated ATPase domains